MNSVHASAAAEAFATDNMPAVFHLRQNVTLSECDDGCNSAWRCPASGESWRGES
jgi:hypothetical protein